LINPIRSCGKPIDRLFIDWPLTHWCNFKCSYCPVLRSLSNDFSKPDHSADPLVTLARLSNIKLPFNMCITGGEPSLHPQVHEIVKRLALMEQCQDISFFTNLVKPADFYVDLSTHGCGKLVIFASYHPQYAHPKFFNKCLEINNAPEIRFSVHVSMSDLPEQWPSTIEFLDFLESNQIEYKPCILSPTQDYQPNYTDEFFSKFQPYLDSAENTAGVSDGWTYFEEVECTFDDGSKQILKDYEIEHRELNRFKGYTCTPASLIVRMDGSINITCTNRKLPLYLGDDIVKKETCPNEICPSRRMTNYYKERSWTT